MSIAEIIEQGMPDGSALDVVNMFLHEKRVESGKKDQLENFAKKLESILKDNVASTVLAECLCQEALSASGKNYDTINEFLRLKEPGTKVGNFFNNLAKALRQKYHSEPFCVKDFAHGFLSYWIRVAKP